MGLDYVSIAKLQQCNRWSLGMDKYFHPTLFINSQTSTVAIVEVWEWISNFIPHPLMQILLFHNCRNAPIPYPTMSQVIAAICTHVWAYVLQNWALWIYLHYIYISIIYIYMQYTICEVGLSRETSLIAYIAHCCECFISILGTRKRN